MVVDGYEYDSFRDSGFHLTSLQLGLDREANEAPRPDSLAEEILSDAIAKYGVLLLRLAGEIAITRTIDPTMAPRVFAA